MLTGPQDHPIDSVLVQIQQASGSSDANPLGRMVNDLSDRIGRQMQPK